MILSGFQFEEQESNIFRTELLQETASGTNTGEWVDRNGIAAMRIGPSPFWHGNVDASKNHLGKYFKANTQYKFDLWIDADNIYSENSNVPGGIIVYYTDGSSYYLAVSGNISSPVGWQHVIYYSDSNKSIKGIGVYYYTGTPAFYRYDSLIIPMTTDTSISKNRIETGQFRESTVNQIEKGGVVSFNEFVEY